MRIRLEGTAVEYRQQGQREGELTLAGPKNLKLAEVLEEIDMSRAAFYRMRARGQAPKLIKLPNGQLRIRRTDLDAWWASCEKDAA